MSKTDARKIDRKGLAELRIRGVLAIERGESPEKLASALGVHRGTVYRWLEKYASGGKEALALKKAPGKSPKVNGKQLQIIYNTVVDKTPDQLKMPFALWTRDLVRQFLLDRFDIQLSRVSIGRLLAKLGLIFQKPLHRAFQQDESLVKSWVSKEFPKIRAMAKLDGATIYFGDEAGIRSDHYSGKTWGVVGKTPVVRTTGARFGVNLISAISPKGDLRFMFTKGRVTADVFVDFLRRLIAYQRKPVYLIVDGHPTHKANLVKQFLQENADRIRMFFLPPYSLEWNPDELVWNTMKNSVGRKSIKGPDDLMEKVRAFMNELRRDVQKVASFFRERHVRYTI